MKTKTIITAFTLMLLASTGIAQSIFDVNNQTACSLEVYIYSFSTTSGACPPTACTPVTTIGPVVCPPNQMTQVSAGGLSSSEEWGLIRAWDLNGSTAGHFGEDGPCGSTSQLPSQLGCGDVTVDMVNCNYADLY